MQDLPDFKWLKYLGEFVNRSKLLSDAGNAYDGSIREIGFNSWTNYESKVSINAYIYHHVAELCGIEFQTVVRDDSTGGRD